MEQEVNVAPIFYDPAKVEDDKKEVLFPEEITKEKNSARWNRVAGWIVDAFRYVWVKSTEQLYYKKEGEILFEPLEDRLLERWARKLFTGCYGEFCTRDVEEVKKQVKMMVEEEIERPSSEILMVSEHIFWDKGNGELTPDPGDKGIFYRLMNTKEATKGIVKIPPFSPAQEKVLWDTYARVKGEIEKGVEEERFEPLKVWANGNHDVYMDLHRAHAYMFLKKKPVGAYMLIGERRNGKSAYAKMTHTIMGTENTSAVQLGKLNDWHGNHKLIGSLMNAPDEEDDAILDKAAMFKTVADHGQVGLDVMGSNHQAFLTCDFMCFFPMNHIPNWKGSGAGACVARSLIIPFTAKLAARDNSNDDFAERTFTADFMAEYLGSVFAYAWYYHRHNIVWSDTMLRYQASYEEDLNNASVYKQLFEKYFDGYTKFSLLYDDYQLWCRETGSKFKSRDELKVVFGEYVSAKRTSIRVGKKAKAAQRVPQYEHSVMHEEFVGKGLESYKTVEHLHKAGMSVVSTLENYMMQKIEEGVMNEPSR